MKLQYRILAATLCLMVCAFPGSGAETHLVRMSGFQFVPRDLTVAQGDTVTWRNDDFDGHDTVSGQNGFPSGAWQSPLLGNGQTFSFTFNVAPGVYHYYCTPHVFSTGMTGTITVTEAVNLPPEVEITSPADGAIFEAPANVAVQAAASDPDGTITQVEFFSNSVSIGVVTGSPYQTTLSNLSSGAYVLTAVATDNDGESTPSDPVEIFVTTVSLSSPRLLAGGEFALDAAGLVAGKTAVLSASSDLVVWTAISTNTTTGATMTFTDPGAPASSHGFYRLLLRP